MEHTAQNPLGYENIQKLVLKFAIPSIIGLLVSALYNIVDQIFIGQGVGMLGNAATNVAFPLSTLCTATGLLFGIGGASGFNLELGKGNETKAGRIACNALSMLFICGSIIAVITLLFLNPLMTAFGASDQVMPYAQTYTGIVAFGFPFLIFSMGGSNIIRADGKPLYSMTCMIIGAVINTILDPLFIFVFKMGIAGAAYATIISQIISFTVTLMYFRKFQSVKLKPEYLVPQFSYVKLVSSLGLASCFNQLAMAVVQIIMNNTLTHYGAKSVYGSEIPLAAVGVITKLNIIFIAFVVGLAQGSQPIHSFNYGAKKYDRVKEAYLLVIKAATVISFIFFLCFMAFPRQILSLFGSGDELYFEFGIRYFRTFMLLTFANGVQPPTANFFTSIGKATTGIFISLTRQVIFLMPLLLIFPLIWGINGVMFAGPFADAASCLVAILLVRNEFKKMTKLQTELSQ